MKVIITMIVYVLLSFCGYCWLASQENDPVTNTQLKREAQPEKHPHIYLKINQTNQLIETLAEKPKAINIEPGNINQAGLSTAINRHVNIPMTDSQYTATSHSPNKRSHK